MHLTIRLILILSLHLFLHLSRGLFPSRFLTIIAMHLLFPLCMLRCPTVLPHPWFYFPSNMLYFYVEFWNQYLSLNMTVFWDYRRDNASSKHLWNVVQFISVNRCMFGRDLQLLRTQAACFLNSDILLSDCTPQHTRGIIFILPIMRTVNLVFTTD